MGKKEKRNYEDMDCLEVNLNVKAELKTDELLRGFRLTEGYVMK